MNAQIISLHDSLFNFLVFLGFLVLFTELFSQCVPLSVYLNG